MNGNLKKQNVLSRLRRVGNEKLGGGANVLATLISGLARRFNISKEYLVKRIHGKHIKNVIFWVRGL